MKRPTYKPAPSSLGREEDRLAKFVVKPEDMSEEQYGWAKEIAEKIGVPMPQQMADSAFYFYYMGASWEEIANKLNMPIGMVLYTGIYYSWYEKKKLVNSVRAGEKVTRADAAAIDLVTDAVVATAAVYKMQIAEVIKDPTKAKHCPMIPKNYKDFLTLLQMLQSLQSDNVEKGKLGGGTSVNVNIANLSGTQNQSSATTVEIKALPTEEENKDREELLRILSKARGD